MRMLRVALLALSGLLMGFAARAADTVNVYTIWPENYARRSSYAHCQAGRH